jgi:tRNA dimethylallyltransferase
MAEALVVTGATATGKTAAAVALARRIGGEIISMDSRQVYRGMDIGTAKPTPAERGGVSHHGFDLVDPDERFNAGRFAVLAREWMGDIRSRGRTPILAGGTGFFLRALTHPMFAEPPLEDWRKEEWKRVLAGFETERLTQWAAALDPGSDIRSADRQRLARVIEVAVLTGRPLSWWHRHAPPAQRPLAPLVFVLELPRAVLTQRIDERVDEMLRQGLVDEVRGLVACGYDERAPGMNTTGYIELLPFLRAQSTLAATAAAIRQATRQYARRQTTWFRHQLPGGVHRLDAALGAERLADIMAGVWREEQR